MILTPVLVFLIQHIKHLNLCQSSLLGPLTLVLKKDTVGSTSGLPRFMTQISLATNFLNTSAFSLARSSVSGLTVNNHLAAGCG
jgi:hypothetical protein